MSVIRLYLDEDAAQHDLLAALRLRQVDVTSAQEQGLVGAADLAQLQWCCAKTEPFTLSMFDTFMPSMANT